jgi:hypothetical protein
MKVYFHNNDDACQASLDFLGDCQSYQEDVIALTSRVPPLTPRPHPYYNRYFSRRYFNTLIRYIITVIWSIGPT